MRDQLPRHVTKPECGIVNLDDNEGRGTHWVAYYIDNKNKIYFDSFGLDPPLEIINYLGHGILCQTFQLQNFDDYICGHLCLHVLTELNNAKSYKDIILNLL